MMLTHSQVSVILSSTVVILFTGALFMSGYVLQQRTLNKLRHAVIQQMQPRPSPKIYLPDKFKQAGQEEQQTIILSSDSDTVEAIEAIIGSAEDSGVVADENNNGQDLDAAIVIEVRPTVPGGGGQKVMLQDIADKVAPVMVEEKPLSRAERRKRIKDEIKRLAQGDEPVYYQRRLW